MEPRWQKQMFSRGPSRPSRELCAMGLIRSAVFTRTRLASYFVQQRVLNRPRSIYQYSNMGPRLSGLTSIFGVVFFVSKSPLGIEGQKKLEKFAILTRKPRSHAWILIYRTWSIVDKWLWKEELVNSENTIIFFVCLPKILIRHCVCFLLGPLEVPRETGNNAYAKIG